METEQTLVHPGDGEKAMQNGCISKRSKADNMLVSSNKDETTKRKKIDASVTATGSNEKINLTVDDMPSEVHCNWRGNEKSMKLFVIFRCLKQYFVT